MENIDSENQNSQSGKSELGFLPTLSNENGGIAIPAVMYFMGVPFFLVILLWFFFFRG